MALELWRLRSQDPTEPQKVGRQSGWRVLSWPLTVVSVVLLLGAPGPALAVTPPPPSTPPPARPGFIGALLVPNSGGWAHVLTRPTNPGALVVLVLPDSPAQRAGLVAGDVVVAIDGEPVLNDEALALRLRLGPTATHALDVDDASSQGRKVDVITGEPPARVLDLIESEVIADPSAASRLVYARDFTDFHTASVILRELVTQFPDFAEAHAARAEILVGLAQMQGDTSSATRAAITSAVSRALALDRASLRVLVGAARVYTALGDSSSAIDAGRAAVGLDRSSASAHRALGSALAAAGDDSGALPELRMAVALSPYNRDYYRDLSAAFRAVGEVDAARQTDRVLDDLDASSGVVVRIAGTPNPVRVGLVVGSALLLGSLAIWIRPRASAARDEGSVVRDLIDAVGGLALFSCAVPFLGRAIELSAGSSLGREIAGHVVPGAAVFVVWMWATRRMGRPGETATDPFAFMTMSAGVGGLWITGTHVQLLWSAIGGNGQIEVALFHSFAGPAMTTLAVFLYRACRTDEHGDENPHLISTPLPR